MSNVFYNNKSKMNASNIGVYILTHNRPQCIMECVNSVLNQVYKEFDIIVSDNSDNDETELLLTPLAREMERFHYFHRKNLGSSQKHFMYIMEHNTYEFYMLFHDDDQMFPEMVGTLFEKLSSDNTLAAVASNAVLRIDGLYTRKKYYSYTEDLYLDREGLISAYSETPAPYPSYMYRRSLAGKVKPCYTHGYKYCDASYLVDIASHGMICFLKEPLMCYNISSIQDSHTFDFMAYESLVNYFLKIAKFRKNVLGLRIFIIYRNSIENYEKGEMVVKKSVLSLLLRYSATNYFLKYLARVFQHYMVLFKRYRSL